MEIKFRFGTKEDVEKIGEFLRQSWLAHVDHEPEFISREVILQSDLVGYFADCFNESGNSHLLIAEIDHEVAGVLKVNVQTIQNFFQQTVVMYLDDIYTIEPHRQKGVAKFLLEQATKLAKEKGIKWLKARIYSFNEPAQKVLKIGGFKNLYSEYFKVL